MARKPKIVGQKNSTVLQSVPAPVGGLNARDTLSNMPATDAVELINWIPDAYGVRSRKGYREWAINLGAPVRSIMPYFGPASTYPASTYLTAPTVMPGKLFAATDSAIYEITTTTDAPASSKALSGTSMAGWISHTMVSNSGGSFLLCASEADGYLYYNGTAWSVPTMGAGAGQINGVDPNTFVHVSLWKRRVWFIQKDTTKAWYLPVDQITGTVSSFDFGPQFKKGGHLAYLANWTIDAGEGIDDFLVAVSNNGEVLVYKGTDPAVSTAFSLVGSWLIGQVPIGRRGYCQFGGDLLLIGADGIYPVSYVTRGGAGLLQASGEEYASQIRARLGPILKSSFTTRGWDMLLHPTERMLLVNFPDVRGYKNCQFALTTTANKWCQFQDIPTTCYGSTGGYSFAGTSDGRVLLLFADLLDNVLYDDADSGFPIYGVILPAFNAFGLPAQQKTFTMVKPHFLSAVSPSYFLDILTDFTPFTEQKYPNPPSVEFARFDSARWDQSYWNALKGREFAEWVGVGGVGATGAALLQTASLGDSLLIALDYLFFPGGPF